MDQPIINEAGTVVGYTPGYCPSCHHTQHIGSVCGCEVGTEKEDDVTLPIRCHCSPENAIKADAGKPSDFRLLAWEAIPEILEVYRYGIRKGYAQDSWRMVAPERYEDALMRHAIAMLRGEERDPESGLRHIAHLAWNAITLICLRPA